MLTIYRRHNKSYPHKSRQYRRCQCSVWVQGTLRGEAIRESLDLTSWEAATNVVREWEAKGRLRSDSAAVPNIAEAIAKWQDVTEGIRRVVQSIRPAEPPATSLRRE
jgi:hypothetical protein